MTCKCAFIVYTSIMGDTELDDFINKLEVEPGITDGRLFYGLRKVKIDDDFQLSLFIYESLSQIIHKANELKKLKDYYHCFYELNIKFAHDEDESYYYNNYSLSDEINEFIKITEANYNLEIEEM